MKKLLKEDFAVPESSSDEEVAPKVGSAFAAFAVDSSSDSPSEEEEVKVVEVVKSKKKRNKRKKAAVAKDDDEYLNEIVQKS